MPVNIKDVFGKISESLNSQFLLTKGGKHRLSMGEKREEIVKGFLRENLPETYGVTQGEIFDTTGEVSNQCDVIIYNSAMPAFRSPSLNLFPVDSVFGVCQVKSSLDKTRLKEAVENIQSVKKMKLKQPTAYFGKFNDTVYCVLFAFDGRIGTMRKNLLETYTDLNVPKEEQIDFICVLNCFVGIAYPKEQGIPLKTESGQDLSEEPIVFLNTGVDSLSFFIPLMLNGFNKPISIYLNLFDYLGPLRYQVF